MSNYKKVTEPGDPFYHLIGTEVTFAHELMTIGGQITSSIGEKAIIRDVSFTKGHWYRTLPDIWVEPKISTIQLQGRDGVSYLPDTFKEFKSIQS